MHTISKAIIKAFKNGNKLFVCGNGGSASDSSHFAGEFVGRFEKERNALPAISLSSDLATITAVGNDYGFDYIFSRQIEGLGKEGDVLITLSTSGTSKNILEAHKKAKEMGIKVFAFPNKTVVRYERMSTASIQEVHKKLIHQISREVEEVMFP